jgi:predicted membrane protein (TIGR00267 family)
MNKKLAKRSFFRRAISDYLFLIKLAKSDGIIRRYFVVNGFDGALTMLGLMIGFAFSRSADLSVLINVCLGAAVALGMSGLTSAYISETAERQRSLSKLEDAMVCDLGESDHAKAAKYTPILVALVNGSAPLLICLFILMPLWLADAGIWLPMEPLYCAMFMALVMVFLLGVFLGRIAGTWWLRSGIETMILAVITATLIYLITG